MLVVFITTGKSKVSHLADRPLSLLASEGASRKDLQFMRFLEEELELGGKRVGGGDEEEWRPDGDVA